MTPRLINLLAALCFALLPLFAVEDNDKPKDRLGLAKLEYGEHSTAASKGCWTCILGNTSSMVMVKLATITSVAKHTYVLEGSQKITEVTIDTTGNNSIRFYCLNSDRANRALDRLSNVREVADKYTERGTRYPAKKYPEGTHSHNIEYQLNSVEHLDTIYESLTYAWLKDTASTLRLKL